MKQKVIIFLLIISFISCQTTKNSTTQNNKIKMPRIENIVLPEIKNSEEEIILDTDIEKNNNFIFAENSNNDAKKNKVTETKKQEKKSFRKNYEITKRGNSNTAKRKKFTYTNQNKNNKIEDTKSKTDLKNIDSSTIARDITDENFDLTNIQNISINELKLKTLEIEENQSFFISLNHSGWIIKSVSPQLLKLLNRENSEQHTAFEFISQGAGVVSLTLLRYDKSNEILYRQPYKITIKPKTWVEIDKTEKTKKNKTEEKKSEKNEEKNYKKDIASELFKQKKYKEAKEIYEGLINEGQKDAETYYKLGLIEKNSGNASKAYEYFFLAVEEKDDIYYINSLLELIKNLKKRKKHSEAIDAFFKYGFTENLDSRTAEELFILLADVYLNMKDYQAAAKEYRRFMENFPDSRFYDKAIFYLAYATENFSNNPDFKEAYRLYNLITSDYPESKYYTLSKNRMLYLDRHYIKLN